jgi:hypothetical protein
VCVLVGPLINVVIIHIGKTTLLNVGLHVLPLAIPVLRAHTMILNPMTTTLLVPELVRRRIVLHILKPVTHNALLEIHVQVKDMLIHVHQEKHVYLEQYHGQYHTQTVHHQECVN